MRKKAKAAYHKAKAAGKSFFSKDTWKPAVKCDQSDWGQTVAKSLVDLGAGFAGAAGGSFLGWAALPVGFAGNVWANKSGHSWARAMSIGMMVSPVDEAIGSSRRAAATGFDIKAEVSEGSERAKNYFGQVYRKFGLHKLFGKKDTTSETTEEAVNGLAGATFDELDKFEQQIVSSGIEHEGGAPSIRKTAPAVYENPALEAFSVNGLDDLNTPHIL
jgi:hypothetical protein